MMVEARKDDDERTVADATADLSRFAQSSTKLFAEQAAVLAVMTAYGMSVAAQMTGMMLGSLRGPGDVDGMTDPVADPKSAPAEQRSTPVEKTSSAKVVPLRPLAKDAVEATPAKPRALRSAKSASGKPVAKKPVRGAVKPVAKAARKPAPVSADDFKKISGIGPRLEQVLNERGIRRYEDLATMSKAALKKLDAELGLEGRTAKDDWAGQAKALSGGKG